jgi:polysaccharide deacetylase family protein (PEP-CTERM system associated)
MRNAMSVDLEDWFCVNNLRSVIPEDSWDAQELRVVQNTERLLTLFERRGVKATFFVLGWIAEKVPEIVRMIEGQGHEIGVHGYRHLLLTHVTAREFEADLVRALNAIENCGLSNTIVGFRAPSFTLVEKTRWALDILSAHGLKYDSSVYPVGFHPDYGMPEAPLMPYHITERLQEFPLTCVRILGRNLACSGGGYFRLLPYAFTRECFRKANREGRPAVFYLHPWEIDPDQPRVRIPLLKRMRHYYGLANTENKLEQLLNDFSFTTIREVLGV